MVDTPYANYSLQYRDKDASKNWGGQIRQEEGRYVESLQKDLKALGVYIWKVDGDFGKKTERAVKMFQWNAKNLKRRQKSRNVSIDIQSYSKGITGIVDPATQREIGRWLEKSFQATGDLIRINESKFSHIELASGFKKISHSSRCDGEMVVSKEMLEYLKSANSKAKELALKSVINQAMRLSNSKVSGAVVTPATKSQHLIGHAIDCNIVDGDNWNNSKTFAKGEETENAKKFISAMKTKGLRWGGDFADTDTPHFDKQVVASTIDYEYKYFFNQRMISENQYIPLETW